MPETAFLLVEVGVYLLAIGCLRHAWARGPSRLLGLVAGMIYGLLLEYGAIVTFHAYIYGHFLIMICCSRSTSAWMRSPFAWASGHGDRSALVRRAARR